MSGASLRASRTTRSVLVTAVLQVRKRLVFSYFCDSLLVDYMLQINEDRIAPEWMVMALPATRFAAEKFMEERDARFDERVKSFESGVSELRSDFRRLDDKVEGVKEDVAKLRTEMKDGFLALHALFAALTAGTAVLEEKVAALGKTIAEIKSMISGIGSQQTRLVWVGGSVCAFLLLAFGGAYAHLIARSDAMQLALVTRSDAVRSELIARSDALRQELTARSDALERESQASYERLYQKLSEMQANSK
jgi:hypothetical protein